MPSIVFALAITMLPLNVRVYDTASVSPDVLERAHVTVQQTLNAVEIQPVWRPCYAAMCLDAPRPDGIELRIVRANRLSPRHSLGTSMVDVAERAGTLATIYQDRVDLLSAASRVDNGRLLGLAIAHEIGHLLLGTASHGTTGLMRARWLIRELRLDRRVDWMFSPFEGSGMRERLVARAALAMAR